MSSRKPKNYVTGTATSLGSTQNITPSRKQQGTYENPRGLHLRFNNARLLEGPSDSGRFYIEIHGITENETHHKIYLKMEFWGACILCKDVFRVALKKWNDRVLERLSRYIDDIGEID
jgi:hypothetical protein